MTLGKLLPTLSLNVSFEENPKGPHVCPTDFEISNKSLGLGAGRER